VIGARLYHIVSSPTGTSIGWQYYMENPLQMLNFRAGGLGIYGAVAGGILGLYLFTRYAKLSFVSFVDMAMMGLPFAQFIGRWGNFFNQELYGYPTTFPWGIPIDAAHRLPIFQDLAKYPVETTRFHPTFLYEALINLAVGCVILYATKRWRTTLKAGDLFLMWGLLYGLGRFLVEFQRPDAWMISGIATAQLIGLGLMVVCGVTLMYRHTGPSKAARVQAAARRRQQR
jgi:phosphatidylglycerol:prolipoprotein diacylglycerol transferase